MLSHTGTQGVDTITGTPCTLGQHNKLHDANKPMKIITLLCFCGGLRETAIYGFDFLTLICCGAKTGCKVLSPQTTVHSTTAQI